MKICAKHKLPEKEETARIYVITMGMPERICSKAPEPSSAQSNKKWEKVENCVHAFDLFILFIVGFVAVKNLVDEKWKRNV